MPIPRIDEELRSPFMMERVAILSHVKASSVPPRSSEVRRIPWQGGKISSNKEEALQKFYQRKLRNADQLTTQQLKAMQTTLGGKLELDDVKNSKKNRPHAKVTTRGNRTVLKTGRVLGPKIDSKKGKKGNFTVKPQAERQPKTVVKMPKRAETGSSTIGISLEDKLGLPLDALVGGSKRSSTAKRR